MSNKTEFEVYALKLQPNGETGFFEACREEEVIGTGWDPRRSCASPAEIADAHKQVDGDVDHKRTTSSGNLYHPIRYIVKDMNEDSGDGPPDYVWVNEGAEYALCKVVSECTTSHDVSDSLREKLTNENGTQIHNIRHVEWTDVPVEFVPGYVKRKFTGRFGTSKKFKKGIDEDAKKVIIQLHSVGNFDSESTIDFGSLKEGLRTSEPEKVFDTLDADDTEELVLDYLQSEGWRITKYSTGDSQAKYECELRRVSDGAREAGFVQVKSGDASLKPKRYSELVEQGEVFLFSSPDGQQEPHADSSFDNITVIDADELLSHLRENTRWLPTPTLLRLSFSL